MKEGRNFGLSGQNYDNFLCLTKDCKQKKKVRNELRTEKTKLKLESKQLKNDAKRAKTETMRSQTKQDEKMSEVMNAQVAPVVAAAEKNNVEKINTDKSQPAEKKKDQTILIVSAVGGLLLLVGIGVVVATRSRAVHFNNAQ